MKIKDLAFEVKEHIKKDFHLWTYLSVFFLAVIFVTFNYSINFERSVVHPFYGKNIGFLVYISYYMIPYCLGLTVILFFKKQIHKLKNPQL